LLASADRALSIELGQSLQRWHYDVRLVHDAASLETLLNYFSPELLIGDHDLWRQLPQPVVSPTDSGRWTSLIVLLSHNQLPPPFSTEAAPAYFVHTGPNLVLRVAPIVQELIGLPAVLSSLAD